MYTNVHSENWLLLMALFVLKNKILKHNISFNIKILQHIIKLLR